ncbi:hypothetical protein B0I37DRAFT_380436 [Chaetomium sp. MPI-CAGE-AT-0009]|nr:hypothetical protein B0I37DRAFT_380436 [Chaetomium sp. MPI-CAGE-AT-0009]
MAEVGACKRKPSWIDEDALHGPKVSGGKEVAKGGGKKKKNKGRGPWPLRNRAPTLARVHHTIHGYPYLMSGARGESSEALLGENRPKTSTGLEYAQLRASSRDLPQPPKPAPVSNGEWRIVRPSVTMGYVYGTSPILIHGPKAGVLPVISPSRKVSLTIPRSIQPYIVSRASEPPPSPTRKPAPPPSPRKQRSNSTAPTSPSTQHPSPHTTTTTTAAAPAARRHPTSPPNSLSTKPAKEAKPAPAQQQPPKTTTTTTTTSRSR